MYLMFSIPYFFFRNSFFNIEFSYFLYMLMNYFWPWLVRRNYNLWFFFLYFLLTLLWMARRMTLFRFTRWLNWLNRFTKLGLTRWVTLFGWTNWLERYRIGWGNQKRKNISRSPHFNTGFYFICRFKTF